MSIFDKLVQTLRKVPPYVEGTPLDRNECLTEMSSDSPIFVSHLEGDFKAIAYELWKILEDVERAELVTTDYLAFNSIVKELAEKRYIYMNDELVKELEQYQLNEKMKTL
jgi:hypothetical protein